MPSDLQRLDHLPRHEPTETDVGDSLSAAEQFLRRLHLTEWRHILFFVEEVLRPRMNDVLLRCATPSQAS